MNIFEKIRLKKYSENRNYINPIKINNIAKSAGLELVLSNSRQIIPFKFLGIGNLINQFLEIVFSYFRFGIQMYSMFRKVEIEKIVKKKLKKRQ